VGLIVVIIIMLYTLLQQKQKRIEEQGNAKRQQTVAQGRKQNEKKQKKHRNIWLITALVLGIVGIIVFILTEDMSRKMAIADIWTIVNAIIFIVEITAILFIIKHNKKNDKTEQN
jgi:Mg2+/citrate symporter